MGFQVRAERRRAAGGFDGTVFLLEDSAATAQVAIWPAAGFNCFQWRTVWQGRELDLLYSDPHFLVSAQPTRNGIPILFPFPNRIRDGHFRWDGQEYQLPRNDSSGRNAIHGFACRHPWRVVDQGADAAAAWVTGEFWAKQDAPEVLALWPADHRLRVTYRLGSGCLRIEAVVENPDQTPLPFGLGYHPYFRVAPGAGQAAEDCVVQAPARSFWELVDSLPTGARRPVDSARDLRQPRPMAGLQLDDVLTDLESVAVPGTDGLLDRGLVRYPGEGAEVHLRTAPAFRELVAFTPPHRQAVCLEPYTCPTDAVHLHERGNDAGLTVLGPGETWKGLVELLFGGRRC